MYTITSIGDTNIDAFAPWISDVARVYYERNKNILGLGSVNDRGESCGALLFEVARNNAYIRHISAAPAEPYDSPLYGMIEEAVAVSLKTGLTVVEACVCTEDEDELELLLSTYGACGFTLLPTAGRQFRIGIGAMLSCQALKGAPQGNGRCRTLADRSPAMLLSLNRLLRESGSAYIPLPLKYDDFMPEYSIVSVGDAGQVDGAVVFGHPADSGFSLIAMAFDGKNAAARAVPMLRRAAEGIRGAADGYAKIHISAVTQTSENLVRKLIPETIEAETRAYEAVRALYHEPEPPHDRHGMMFRYLDSDGEDIIWKA